MCQSARCPLPRARAESRGPPPRHFGDRAAARFIRIDTMTRACETRAASADGARGVLGFTRGAKWAGVRRPSFARAFGLRAVAPAATATAALDRRDARGSRPDITARAAVAVRHDVAARAADTVAVHFAARAAHVVRAGRVAGAGAALDRLAAVVHEGAAGLC